MERKIAKASAGSQTNRLLDRIPGVGTLTASAIAASVPDPCVFKSGRDFAAWLGLTPEAELERRKGQARRCHQAEQSVHPQIARRGLDVGSAPRPGKRSGPLADWIAARRKRKPERVVAVALANKLARICWAIMTTGELFRRESFART